MNALEKRWQKYLKECDLYEQKQKDYFQSLAGKSFLKQNQEWEKKWQKYKNGNGKHPGMPPKGFNESKPVSPLVKYCQLLPEPNSLRPNDYLIILGVLHDGYNWKDGNKSIYICPELVKNGTIIDELYCPEDGYSKNPEYKEIIEEALQQVKKVIITKFDSTDNTKTKPPGNEEEKEEIHLDEPVLALLNWFNDLQPNICYPTQYANSLCKTDKNYRTKKTILGYAKILMQKDLIKRPKGKLKGFVITKKGQQYIQECFP